MLEFIIDSRRCNSGQLPSRVADCEPSLVLFNYFTPMAVCVEIIIKIASIEAKRYADEYEVDEDKQTSLTSLLCVSSIKNVLNSWGINDRLIEDVKAKILAPNNKYKHCLIIDSPRISYDHNAATTLNCFKVFYKFMSRYYEHCTGKEAPAWKEDEFLKLYESKAQMFIDKEKKAYHT